MNSAFKAALSSARQIVITEFNREGPVHLRSGSADHNRSPRLVRFEHVKSLGAGKLRHAIQFFLRRAMRFCELLARETLPLRSRSLGEIFDAERLRARPTPNDQRYGYWLVQICGFCGCAFLE
jgi:hypothetical protein